MFFTALARTGDTQTVRGKGTFDDIVFVATAILPATEQDNEPEPRITHLVDLFLNGIGAH